MAVGGVVVDAVAPVGPAAQAGHIGLGSGFIQKDKAAYIDPGQDFLPIGAGPLDVFAVLLAGPECLFLYVRPRSFKA